MVSGAKFSSPVIPVTPSPTREASCVVEPVPSGLIVKVPQTELLKPLSITPVSDGINSSTLGGIVARRYPLRERWPPGHLHF